MNNDNCKTVIHTIQYALENANLRNGRGAESRELLAAIGKAAGQMLYEYASRRNNAVHEIATLTGQDTPELDDSVKVLLEEEREIRHAMRIFVMLEQRNFEVALGIGEDEEK